MGHAGDDLGQHAVAKNSRQVYMGAGEQRAGVQGSWGTKGRCTRGAGEPRAGVQGSWGKEGRQVCMGQLGARRAGVHGELGDRGLVCRGAGGKKGR